MNRDVAAKIADDLIRQHCPAGWRWVWSTAKTQYGLCDYGCQTIKLSWPLTEVNDEDAFRQNVLHEIAHVLDGPYTPAHGPSWRSHARRLGVRRPRACTVGVAVLPGNVVGTCELGCGYVWRQHKITYSTYTRSICPSCSDRATKLWVYLDWTRADGTPIPRPKQPAPRRRRVRRRYA